MRNKAIQKNIFEEINRTIELKNKLTVAKNNINKAIVRGGCTFRRFKGNSSEYNQNVRTL